MQNFIGNICKTQFIGDSDCNDKPPAPPAPPGPYDRVIGTANGLDDYTTSYNSPTGIMVLRFQGTNNANSVPTITAKWNGVAMTFAPIVADNVKGHPVMFLAYIRGGATGSHNIEIDVTSGSVGFGLIRIGDLSALSASPIGFTSGGLSIDEEDLPGLIDINITSQAPGAGQLSQQAVFMDRNSYPITQYYGATEQWQTYQIFTGPNKVTNGDFAADTNWTKGQGWTIADGTANRLSGSGNSNLTQNFAGITQVPHLFSMDIVARGSIGNMQMLLNGTSVQAISNILIWPGHYEYIITPAAARTGVILTSVGSANGTKIDNVILAEYLGQIAGYFGTQVTPPSGQITLEANNYNDVSIGGWLVVELKGAVLP